MSNSVSKICKGLAACEIALERLLEGRAIVPAHVGLNFSKITAGIVSHEAGFDRGYLKKTRRAHLPLLAKIAAVRQGDAKSVSQSVLHKHKALERKILEIEERMLAIITQRNQVLTQNLQLWERIKDLEGAVINRKISTIG